MQSDKEGFLQPIIDKSQCIECEKCKQVCPVLNNIAKEGSSATLAYAAVCQEESGEVRRRSSSGGLFWCFAQWVLQNNGVVVGAIMAEDGLKVQHILIDSGESLTSLMGSKYVQSEKGDIFYMVKKSLQEGKPVLFTGTPCEVAGLLLYIPEYLKDKLYTIDLICHGVPSPEVWKRYVIERNWVAKQIYFRDKTKGWKTFYLRISDKSGDSMERQGDNLYMRGFLSHLYLRESCHQCLFKGVARASDITLGDFWKVNEFFEDFDDDKGVSLVFLHTEKAKNLFEGVKGVFKIEYREVDAMSAARSNPMTLYSSCPHKKRTKFFNRFNDISVIKNIRRLTRRPLMCRIAARIKRIIIKDSRRGQ